MMGTADEPFTGVNTDMEHEREGIDSRHGLKLDIVS